MVAATANGSVEAVRAELDRILAAPAFRHATVLSRLLRYLVECCCTGARLPPKEYAIGVEVFGRPDFDPQTDTIVRVQVRRLRQQLERYYAAEGRDDPLRIRIPPGHYAVEIVPHVPTAASVRPAATGSATVPVRYGRRSTDTATAPALPPPPAGRRRVLRALYAAPVRRPRVALLLIAVLVVAVGLLGWRWLARRDVAMNVLAPAADTPFNPPAHSLVVLPFASLDVNPRQQYFSDGITEELTDRLGRNPALRVIAWDTAAHYRNSRQTAQAIGRALDVADLVNGSIERSGDQAEVAVELVSTRTGLQLWSASYDVSLANLLAVQDRISAAIAGALRVKLVGAAPPRPVNAAAHELVLKGRALAKEASDGSLAAARQDFERAIALDPDYSEAHALLAQVLFVLSAKSSPPLRSALPRVRQQAEAALALDPRNADAWVALAESDDNSTPSQDSAGRAAFRKALALDPNDVAAHIGYGVLLSPRRDLDQDRIATELDPANAIAWNNLATDQQDLGDWKAMLHSATVLIRLDPEDVDAAFLVAFADQRLHRFRAMTAAFNLVRPQTALGRALVGAGRQTYRAVTDRAARPAALAAVARFGRYRSEDALGNAIQMDLALGATGPALQLLGVECADDPVPCDDLGVNVMYRALRRNPRFQALAKQYTGVSME